MHNVELNHWGKQKVDSVSIIQVQPYLKVNVISCRCCCTLGGIRNKPLFNKTLTIALIHNVLEKLSSPPPIEFNVYKC